MKTSNFYDKVYNIVQMIPSGKVTTYGAIAEATGMKSSARTVGWALNSAKSIRDIPFHRVVNRNGELTGKFNFETPNLMKELLLSEGVEFHGEKVKMDKCFWKPPIS